MMINGNTVTVFIVDNQPLFRLGLRTALNQTEGVSVVGEGSLSYESVGLVSRSQPRLVLVGIEAEHLRGVDICRRIGECCPDLPIIVMTPAEDTGELVDVVRSGASGYLSKLAHVDGILRAIRKACEGDMPIRDAVAASPEASRRLLSEFQEMSRNPRLKDVIAPLSPRELELLRLMGQGRSNKEIAHTLHITAQTVKNHITSILRKLDVNDRTQAVLAGLRYGWITLEEAAPDRDEEVALPQPVVRARTPHFAPALSR